MAEIKTKRTDANVTEFINSFTQTEQRRKDSFELLDLMREETGCEPAMWGPSIIGFGSFHYKSDRSGQEGDWPLVGFSPRKAALTLYVYSGSAKHAHLLEGLGKFKMGKACIYVKKLSDLNQDSLRNMIRETIRLLREKYGE